ncbi:hypothetical protein B0T20DRAFT_410861 [Sordaria brevicollis]|uniref:DUF7704 domain-containing protein n=1 Tax=Sordaria brevicollis TaxID=83679 RepID=A0AAE0PED0_SORBR|nr:hypothetical protein B0T20DRAFT_410861 [Sordaria brevicollis]
MAPASSQTTTASATATSTIPLLYRIVLLYIEPFFALNGAFMVFFQPHKYADLMTRSSIPYEPSTQHLYTQIGSLWLLFAFNQAIILRLYDDVRLWKLMCVGMLLSDAGHNWSMVQGLGGWNQWAKVGEWKASDWTLFLSTTPLMLVRILILLQSSGKRRQARGNFVHGI